MIWVRALVRALVRYLASATGAYSGSPTVLELPDGRVYVLLADRDANVQADLHGPNRFWESEAGRAYRAECALELHDPDVYGFMMLVLKRAASRPELAFRVQVEPEWMPAFTAGFARVAAETQFASK